MRQAHLIYVGIIALMLAGCNTGRTRFDTAETTYDAGRKSLENRKCWLAQQVFQNLLSDFPGSHLVDDSQFALAQSYYCSKDYVTAIFEFERVLNEYPTSDYVDDARYEIGMCYYEQSRGVHHDQSDTQKAIREFQRFIEDYPRSDRLQEAKERIGELRNKLAKKMLMIADNYLKWRAPVSAERYCEEALRLYSDTESVPQMYFVLAVSKHRKGDLEDALEILVRLQAQDLKTKFKDSVGEAIDEVREDLAERPPEVPAASDTARDSVEAGEVGAEIDKDAVGLGK